MRPSVLTLAPQNKQRNKPSCKFLGQRAGLLLAVKGEKLIFLFELNFILVLYSTTHKLNLISHLYLFFVLKILFTNYLNIGLGFLFSFLVLGWNPGPMYPGRASTTKLQCQSNALIFMPQNINENMNYQTIIVDKALIFFKYFCLVYPAVL
jgi:hypothetical protein